MAVEHEACDIRELAGTEAGGLGQMDDLSKVPPHPFVLERGGGNRGMTAVGLAAATAAETVGDVRATLQQVHNTAIGAGDVLAKAGPTGGARGRRHRSPQFRSDSA